MIECTEYNEGRVLEVHASGKLTKADYARFTPAVERLIGRHGKINVLFEMHEFHGWEGSALWQDLKFDVKHFRDIGRVAMVGDTKWEHGMARFCKPFTTAEVRYFPHDQIEQARTWVAGAKPMRQAA